MNREIGIGIIGLGMGRAMLEVNKADGYRSEVRAICDTNVKKLLEKKNEFNIPVATDNYKEIINRKDIDLIGIFTPDKLHIQIIRDCLEAGKHIICTKPMVDKLEDAIEVVELVRKYNRKFLVGQTRRYVKHNMKAKEFYDTGKIGKPMMAVANYIHGDFWKVFSRAAWRYEDPKDFIFGAACHAIDHLRWYFGDVDEVFAYGCTSPVDTRYPQDIEMNYLAVMKFKNGVIGKMGLGIGIVAPPKGSIAGEGFQVYGTNGTIIGHQVRYLDGGDKNKPETIDFTKEDMVDFDGKEYTGHYGAVMQYIKEMEDCIINDRKPSVNEIDGAKTTAISAACKESAKTSKVVKVFNEF